MHEDTAETLLGTQSSHEEPQSGVSGEPQGGGWRRLDPPVAVRAFLADTWVVVLADAVNDDTGELRVLWPLADSRGLGEVYHQVLDRSHHQTPAGGLGP
jgi:hypothetical protein